MRLPRTAEQAKALEDQPDRLLQSKIRIEAQPVLAMPDIADRHTDPEFPAPCLRPGSVQHAGADHAELELADAALHAEQEAIVRPARIVDAVEVDHPGLDKAAELEQVMPIAAVAREPGGIEAEHGADLAGA
jgi:hypothetical protein